MKTAIVALALAGCLGQLAGAAGAADPVNPDSAIVQDFTKRVNDYMQIHKDAERKMPKLKPTNAVADIRRHTRALGEVIRQNRSSANQGDIFTSAIATEFRRLIGLAMAGGNTRRVERSMKNAEPVRMVLKVNDPYPSGIPRQSTPPTLLLNLPPLPPELEYRIVSRSLVLLDSKANIVVDVMPNAIA
jgi:hypothetical protein